jgi:tetratricopeptide (TPR) repeat protein
VRRATRGEAPRGRLRDVNTAGNFQVLKVLSWSVLGGVVGGLLGVYGLVQEEWGLGTTALLAAFGWIVSFLFPLLVSGATGRAARVLSTPSGRTTPRKRDHSFAESLVARGLYDDGIRAFEAAIAEDPHDPTPFLKIARVYRDRLGRYEDAARWFKRALTVSSMTPGPARLARRELVELYVSKMRDPSRAAPLLARTADEHAGTEEGDWAAETLSRIRASIPCHVEPG